LIFLVETPFQTKQGPVKRGQVIAVAKEQAKALLRAGKITELEPCRVCRTFSWWLSVSGVLVCGVCHPPVSPAVVKRWIGDPEVLNRMKTDKGAFNLSWEELRERRQRKGRA